MTTEQPARTNEVPGYVRANGSPPQPGAAWNVLRAALQSDATVLLCCHKTNKPRRFVTEMHFKKRKSDFYNLSASAPIAQRRRSGEVSRFF